MKTLTRDLLDEITRRLVDELHPEQIIRFGSHAWGTPNEDSDVDLLVVVPDGARLEGSRAACPRRAPRAWNTQGYPRANTIAGRATSAGVRIAGK